MKKKYMYVAFLATLLFCCFSVKAQVQTLSATYSAGDIPTAYGAYDSTCNGSSTALTVTLPATAGSWEVVSVDVQYDMTADNVAYMSEQRSRITCQNTATTELEQNGVGSTEGTYSYSRTGLTIANGFYAGGTNLVFEMEAWRTWGNSSPNAGCGTYYNKVDNNTWVVTVNYQVPPTCVPPSNVQIGNETTSSVDFSWVDLNSVTPASWTIEYGAPGFVQGAGTTQVTNTSSGTISGLTQNTDYEFYVQSDCGAVDGLSVWDGPYEFSTTVDCSGYSLGITSATDGTIACQGSTMLSAVSTGTGDDIYWYDAALGGTVVGFGSDFVTPVLSSTTSYWAAEVVTTGSNVPGVGLSTYSGSYGSTLYTTDKGIEFNATNSFTIVDVEVFSTSSSTGSADIVLLDDTGTSLASTNVSFPTGSDASPTPMTIPLNFIVPGPGDYRLVARNPSGTVDLMYEYNYPSAGYPFAIGSSGTMEEGVSSSYTYEYYYYYFYNWTILEGEVACESTRQEVIATVDLNGDIQVTSLPYNDSNNDTSNYGDPFEGAPGASCNTTENYLNGNDVVYKFTAPATELVDILISDLTGFYGSVFVYDSCADVMSSCLGGAIAGPSDADFGIEDFSVTAGEDYYVVVSSWLTPTIGYTLDIIPFSCASLPSPTGVSPQLFNSGETLADLEVDTTKDTAVLTWYSDLAMTSQISDTALMVDGNTYYVTQTFAGCESAPLSIMVNERDCSSLGITATTTETVNCQGEVTMTATATGTGDDVYWYENQTGGNPISFGNSFTSPNLTSTTSYWVSETVVDATIVNSVGLGNWSYSSSSSAGSNYRRGLYFTASESFTINTVDVYDASSAGGTANIELYDTDTNVMLYQKVVSLPGGGSSASPVQVTLSLNFFVPSAGNYKLVANDSPSLKYEYDYSNAYVQYPMSIGSVGEIYEGGYSYTSGSNEYEYTFDYYYYYFYNWTITEGEFICESPRTEVVATVNQTGDVLVDFTDLPYTTSDSTSIYGDNFEGDPGSSCPGAGYLDGNEVVYQYTADPVNDDVLQIELTGITNSETGMYIYTSCGDIGANCLDGGTNEDTPSFINISDYPVSAGETLYIVISSESNSVNYTLDIYGFDCSSVDAPIVDDVSPYFVPPNTLDDLMVEEDLNSSGLNWYSDAGATMVIPSTTLLVDGTTYYVTQTILGCESSPLAITPIEFDCASMGVTQADSVTICSPGGDVDLSVISNGIGDNVYWYDAATAGNLVGVGSAITADVTQTTSYWASEVFIGNSEMITGPHGLTSPQYGYGSTLTNRGVVFDVDKPFVLESVDIFSVSSGGGNVVIGLYDDSGSLLQSVNFIVPSGGSTASPVQATVDLGFDITKPGEYRLVKSSGTASMSYEYSTPSYPYALGTSGELVGGAVSLIASASSNYSYFFYNWMITEQDVICESSRTEIVVTVNDVPTATPTGNGTQDFCEGSTIADLVVVGADITWYSSDVSSSSLPMNQALVDGAVYYASQTVNTCESDGRLPVTVTVKGNSDLPVATVNQSFVQGDTVESLIVFGDNLTWYTSIDGFIFTQIDPSSVTLQDQVTYYVTQTVNGLCESEKLAITVHVGSLDINDPLFTGLSFYPNPMRNNITIENTNVIDQVEVYSLLGQKVMKEQSNQNTVNLNVSHLATGTYFVKVTVSGKLAVFKVVKE